MTSADVRSPASRAAQARRRVIGLVLIWTVVLANAAVIIWLWVHAGNLHAKNSAEALTSLARITGLLSAYLALLQVILLSRLPPLERLVGFDRLTIWHRWNGHATIYLVVAHVVFSVWGYSLTDQFSIGQEISTMLGGGNYPGMIKATVGTAFMLAVVATSIVVVRRCMRYEWWYAVHLLAYAGIALAWFHQIPTGNELVTDTTAANYWRSLYVVTLAALIVFRFLAPALQAARYRLRVEAVAPEGPDTVSLWITGRGLERLRAEPGQFFLWRFLTRGHWSLAHPFSLSAAPDGRTLRITVKALGDHTARLRAMPVGTRVVTEGPFGVFTDAGRHREKVALIAGGIGITPVRALVQKTDGDVVVLYRALTEEHFVFRSELDELAQSRGITIHYIAGDHRDPGAEHLLSPAHLLELVPDLSERDVYVCGPAPMTKNTVRHVRDAGVHRRQIHTERFSL